MNTVEFLESARADIGSATWLPTERAQWERPKCIPVDECADRYRRVVDGSHEGPWSTDFTAYLREPMNCYLLPTVEDVTLLFGAQNGKTSVLENILAFMVIVKPRPAMWVMPRETDYHYIHDRRIKRMIDESPELQKHLTGRHDDVTQEGITFDRMHLYYANGQSTAAMKSKPIHTLLLDEIDEYRDSASQGDPVSMAKQRTNTFIDRKCYTSSTPTNSRGRIWRRWKVSDQRLYFVACPHCDAWQTLEWEQVRWDGDDTWRAEDRAETARLHCQACDETITDAERRRTVRNGVWVQDGATLNEDGTVENERPSRHRGYRLTSLYSPFLDIGDLVYRYLSEELGDFVRQMLALPFDQQVMAVKKEQLDEVIAEYPRDTVPEGATMLTAAVDVQGHKLGFFYVIRAWGPEGRSWLVRAGRCRNWSTIESDVIKGVYGDLPVTFTLIDSGDGNRTDEVYDFCRGFKMSCAPSKGQRTNRSGAPIQWSRPDRRPGGRRVVFGIDLATIDTMFFKDWLAACVAGERAPWLAHRNDEGNLNEWLAHMRSEQKVMIRNKAAWDLKPGKVRNDYWDCEAMALAAWYHKVGQHGTKTPVGSSPVRVRQGQGGNITKPRERPRMFGGRRR